MIRHIAMFLKSGIPIYNSEVSGTAVRKTRRRRSQAIVKRYAFHANTIKLFLQVSLVLKPGNSCINQLTSIAHEIYSSFDEGLEVRSVFLDISKAFDKVWPDGIISNYIRKFTKSFT